MASEYAGKVVVVSGGSRGIGRGIAADFAAEGAQTVLAASSSGESRRRGRRRLPRPAARRRRDVCAADLRELDGCETVIPLVPRSSRPLRHSGELRPAPPGRQFLDLPRRGLAGRLRAQVLRLRAPVPAVLAAAQGRARPRRQHHRRRRAHAWRRNSDRRVRQRGDGQFLEGTLATRQARRRQRQRDPSGRDRHRAGRSSLPDSARGASGKSIDVRADAIAKDGIRRIGKPEDVAALTLVPVLGEARGTSRAPRSPSMAVRHRGFINRRCLSIRVA